MMKQTVTHPRLPRFPPLRFVELLTLLSRRRVDLAGTRARRSSTVIAPFRSGKVLL